MNFVPKSVPDATWDDTYETTGRFMLMSLTDLEDIPEPDYLIDDWLTDGFNVTYGAPGSYKSFTALGQALSIAADRPWMGRPVQHGSVVYVAGEGVSGIKKRAGAWLVANDLDDVADFFVIGNAPHLTDDNDVDELIASIKEWTSPVLVVIDTLAMTMGDGDENRASDMGRYVDAVQRIRREVGCAVNLIHHTSKDGEYERGSNSLRGACDFMTKVSASGTTITLKNDRNKEDEKSAPLTLTAEKIGGSAVLASSSLSTDDNGPRLKAKSRELLRFLSVETDDNGLSRGKLIEAMGWAPATLDRWLKPLKDQGLVEKRGETVDATFRITDLGVSHCHQ